jgi:hypothetical protein
MNNIFYYTHILFKGSTLLKRLAMICGLLLILKTAQTQSAVVRLPSPAGKFNVGTEVFHWIDHTRIDTLNGHNGYREVLVQIWYPAQEISNNKSPYIIHLDTSFGHALYQFYQSIQTNSNRKIAVAKGKFPVIIFSTGRAAGAYGYTSIAENMAANGYIFVGVNSPGSSQTFFQSGYVQPLQRWSPPSAAIYASYEAVDNFFSEAMHIIPQDMLFVEEKLVSLNQSRMFKNRLDLNASGMMGHSLGALAATEACYLSARCKSVLALEASQSKNVREGKMAKPIGFVVSEEDLAYDTARLYTKMILKNLKAPFYFYTVANAGHNTFSDIPFTRKAMGSGMFNYKIDVLKGIYLTRQIALDFFEKTLRKKDSSLYRISEKYSEVKLRIY